MARDNIKLTALDKTPISDAALSADFRAAEKYGRFWVGREGLYYRDGLKKYYVPMDAIDHAFTRVREVNTHCCCGKYNMYTYSLVLRSGEKELAEIYSDEDEASVDKVQALLKERRPGIELGYNKGA